MKYGLCFGVLAISMASASYADMGPRMAEYCDVNPGKCAQIKQHMQVNCSSHPQRCITQHAKAQESASNAKVTCESDPDKCINHQRRFSKEVKELKAEKYKRP